MSVEFIDVVEKNLSVNFLFAFEIEINRPFTELGFFRDTLNRDRAEAILKKKLSRCL